MSESKGLQHLQQLSIYSPVGYFLKKMSLINSVPTWRFHLGFVIVLIMTLALILKQGTQSSQRLPPPISRHPKASKIPFKVTTPNALTSITETEREIQNQTQIPVHKPEPLITIRTSVTNQSLYTHGFIKPPAVYLNMKGGLGNQLFQYACHYAIARKNNWPLYSYVSQKEVKKNRTFGPWKRDFALDYFNIPLFPWNIVDETWNVSDITWINDATILSGLYPKDEIVAQSGQDYCISEAFFSPYKAEILKMFTFKEVPISPTVEMWLSLINSSATSVGIHIRRGDFVLINVSVPISFQKNAMNQLSKMVDTTPTFFIFTDDVPFAEKEFKTEGSGLNGSRIHLVSKSKLSSLEEFYLLSRCKHDIIPNSSFGWWAAYLNPNPKKIVIAAHQNLKLFDSMFEGEDMANTRNFNKFMVRNLYYPYEWITVDPFVNVTGF